jgi:Type IV secretory pathway, TrbL components
MAIVVLVLWLFTARRRVLPAGDQQPGPCPPRGHHSGGRASQSPRRASHSPRRGRRFRIAGCLEARDAAGGAGPVRSALADRGQERAGRAGAAVAAGVRPSGVRDRGPGVLAGLHDGARPGAGLDRVRAGDSRRLPGTDLVHGQHARGQARGATWGRASAGVQDPPRPAARQRGHGDLRAGRPDRPHPEPLRHQKVASAPDRLHGIGGDERPPSLGACVVGSMISAAVCTDHYP